MNHSELQAYFQQRLVRKRPAAGIDCLLQPATVEFLQRVGLPCYEELNFAFDDQLSLTSGGLVQLHQHHAERARAVYLDPRQADAVFSSPVATDDNFISSSVHQFAWCLYELEHFFSAVYWPRVLGTTYGDPSGPQSRQAYATYLEDRLRAADPLVAERGYYWFCYAESVEHGLLL